MSRVVLSSEKVSPEALKAITNYHQNVVSEVISAVNSNDVVVVGMAHNPFVAKARKALKEKGIKYTYLGYGNYWSQWKPRLAIKLWSGWPTFPQVFVKGTLVGGYTDLEKMLKEGKLS